MDDIIVKRFLEKFSCDLVSGCWLWLGSCSGFGYGQFFDGVTMARAHRFSWRYHVGPIPEGLCVLHSCDNPPCVNPGHLWVGTVADNNADMVAKGRNRNVFTADNPHRLLTAADARSILASEETSGQLARRYGVNVSSIYSIRNRRTWKHVDDDDHAPSWAGCRVRAKLTESDVRGIRASDETERVLASRYGVHKSNIGHIRRRATWKHVD